jgi:hypothetical protein
MNYAKNVDWDDIFGLLNLCATLAAFRKASRA